MRATERRTGPYAHEPDMCREIRFATAGPVERSFSIVFATGCVTRPEDKAARGIAVLDNDNARVVTDGLRPVRGEPDESDPVATIAIEVVANMDWNTFARTCRSSSRFRGGISDIDILSDIPDAGDANAQISLGLIDKVPSDIRTALMRDAHVSEQVPYTFPPMNRRRMEAEVISAAKSNEDSVGPGWKVLPEDGWNRTGRVHGKPLPDPGLDHDWRVQVTRTPSVLVEAARRFAEPYTQAPSEIMGLGPLAKAECAFSDDADLFLTRLGEQSVTAPTMDAFRTRVREMEDDQLVHLWAACRVMAEDLSVEELRENLPYHVHDLRQEFEASIGSTIEPV